MSSNSRFLRLGLLAGLLAAYPVWAQTSSITCPASFTAGAGGTWAAQCAIAFQLGSTAADAAGIGVQANGSSGAPAAAVTFANSLATAPFLNQSSGISVSVGWSGISPQLTGNVTLGTVTISIPSGAPGGKPYAVSFNPGEPTIQCCGTFGTPEAISAGAAQTVTIPTVLTITSPASGATLSAATAGTAFSKTIATSGGTAPLSFSLTGSWPAGFTISSGGVISGTFAAAASYSGTLGVNVKDSSNPQESASATYSLTVNAALSGMVDAITGTTNLPTGTQGAAYTSGNITVTGGTPNYSWSTTANLAAYGLTLNAGATNTVTITGTPSAPVNGLSIPLKVIDANAASLTTSFSLTINGPLTLSAGTALPTSTVGTAYSSGAAISASGGTPPYTFTVNNGLPAGLTIAPTTGQITGTPSNGANGAYGNIQVTVTDSAASTVTHTFSMTVDLAITLTAPATIPGGTTGAPYPSGSNFSATGGSGTYTWSVTGLPGVSANPASGAATSLSGSPTVASAADTVTVTVTDSNNATASKTYNNVVIAVGVSITGPAAGALQPGTLNTAYMAQGQPVTIATAGGTGPYTWTLSAGSTPAGLTLSPTGTGGNGATGLISGSPTAAGGPSTFTVQVTDSVGSVSTRQFSITVYAKPVVTGPASLSTATVSSAYTNANAFSLTGGAPTVVWSATGLPNGVTINASTGAIGGTPAAGTNTNAGLGSPNTPDSIVVTVTDSNGVTSSASATLTVNPALTVTPATLPVGIPTVAYKTTTLTPSGGSGTGYTFSATGLPAGLALSGAGVLSGTPGANAATGSPYSVPVTLTDSIGATRTFQYTLAVAPPLSISGPGSLPAGTVSVAYVLGAASTVTAAGGTPPYNFSATGLPPGLSISSSTGQISGTPTAVAGSPYSVTASVTDANGTIATKSYSIIVGALPLQIITGLLPTGILNAPYPSTSIVAQGGVPPYSWTVTGLPPGLTTDGNGDISGTPTTTTGSPFSVTVKLSDATLNSVSRTYSLTITGTLTVVSPTTLPAAALNTAYPATTVTAGGGIAPFTWAATGLPTGLSINVATGVISGTPTTAAGSPYSVVVTVTDSTGKTASMTYTLAVSSTPLTISGPASLPTGTVGTAYTTTVTATGGSGVYTFTATGLPSGLSIGAGTGAISGTPATGTAGTDSVVVTVTDTNSATATKTYSLTINGIPTNPPVIASVSAVAYGQATIAPNMYVGIYGSNFAPVAFTDTWTQHITNGNLPTTLDGISVTIGGDLAYVYYVSATQINALVPNVGFGPLQVTVTTSVGTSNAMTVTSQQFSPGIIAWPNPSGNSPGDATQQPVATHLNYTEAAANGTFAGTTTVPAAPGETIVLWGSGFGPTTPAYPFGVAVPSTGTYTTTNNVTVMLNNAPIAVYENLATLTAGSAGLYQIGVTIPASLPNGTYPISATINGVATPTLTLTVHN